jgi:hypothetical protein
MNQKLKECVMLHSVNTSSHLGITYNSIIRGWKFVYDVKVFDFTSFLRHRLRQIKPRFKNAR